MQDHPYQRRYVDTWVLMSMIAAATSQVGIFPDVANLPLRPPAVMAKATASIDVLSGGRLERAPGSRRILGRHRGVRRATPHPRDALAVLEEAIMVTRLA